MYIVQSFVSNDRTLLLHNALIIYKGICGICCDLLNCNIIAVLKCPKLLLNRNAVCIDFESTAQKNVLDVRCA